MGGFDIIGSGRHKIETPEQFESSAKYCTELDLDGLVVIGGDDDKWCEDAAQRTALASMEVYCVQSS